MHRFYIEALQVNQGRLTLPPEVAHQIARVLRLRPEEAITLFDVSGIDTTARLTTVSSERVEAQVVAQTPNLAEPRVKLTLCQALLKGERFEVVLQKATEVGVSAFVPLVSKRVIPRDVTGVEQARYPRWRRIIREAAEQCGRGRVPELRPPLSLQDALRQARGLVLLPWEEERSLDLRDVLRGRTAQEVTVFIGPEGGFEEAEAQQAHEAGAQVVSLGRRVLRSETAGVVAAALVLHALGDLG